MPWKLSAGRLFQMTGTLSTAFMKERLAKLVVSFGIVGIVVRRCVVSFGTVGIVVRRFDGRVMRVNVLCVRVDLLVMYGLSQSIIVR